MENEFLKALIAKNGGVEKGAKAAFSRLSGFTEASVSRWASGRKPDERYWQRIAELLGITVAKLISMYPERPKKQRVVHSGEIDVWVEVVMVVSSEPFRLPLGNNDSLEVLPVKTKEGDGKLLAAKIAGDWFEPTAPDGDYIVWSKTAPYQDEDIVLMEVTGGLAFFWVKASGKTILLKPVSKGVKEMRGSREDLKVAGVVRYFIRKRPTPPWKK